MEWVPPATRAACSYANDPRIGLEPVAVLNGTLLC